MLGFIYAMFRKGSKIRGDIVAAKSDDFKE